MCEPGVKRCHTYSSQNKARVVCKLLCTNCTIEKTKNNCMIKHLGKINKSNEKNPPSQESPKKAIPSISKNEIQALDKCLKILIGVPLKIILHNKKKALKRLVSVIGLKNPDLSTTNGYGYVCTSSVIRHSSVFMFYSCQNLDGKCAIESCFEPLKSTTKYLHFVQSFEVVEIHCGQWSFCLLLLTDFFVSTLFRFKP